MPVNPLRDGRFISSEIYRLLGSAAVQKTYIEEKKAERVFCGSMDTETTAKPLSWGKFGERRLFNKLGLEYEPLSTDTILHPTLGDYWAGTPDLRGATVTGEVKCPWPKNFVKMATALENKDVELFKSDKDLKKAYWQAISNAILRSSPEVEIICYMPLVSEFEAVTTEAKDYVEGYNEHAFKWIAYANTPAELPLLPDNSKLESLTRWRFPLPTADVILLTNAVKSAVIKLNE